MMIRENITEYLLKEDISIDKAEEISSNILDIIENSGLEIDEFREDTGIESWTKEYVLEHIKLKTKKTSLSIMVLFMLEDVGLSLSGNGWLDDDDLTMNIIDEIYEAEQEYIGCKQLFINTKIMNLNLS